MAVHVPPSHGPGAIATVGEKKMIEVSIKIERDKVLRKETLSDVVNITEVALFLFELEKLKQKILEIEFKPFYQIKKGGGKK